MKTFLFGIFILGFSTIQGQNFLIDGEILHPYEGYLYLMYGNKIDSTRVVNQRFTFSGSVPYPMKANIATLRNNRQTGFLMLENSRLIVDIAIENKRNVNFKAVRGSQSVTQVKNFIILKNKNRNVANLSDILYQRLNDLIRSNPKNQFYGMLLAETFSERKINYKQAQQLSELLDKQAQDPEDISKIQILLETLQKTQVGAKFPNIEFPNNKDQILGLDVVKKHFTLVSFSSTECIACIEIDRKYATIYDQYKNKGFTIYEIFLEHDKEAYLGHLSREGFKWHTVLALKKYNNPIIKSLGIVEVPTNFLLDNSGKIIAINIGPNLLSRKLSEYLDKKK